MPRSPPAGPVAGGLGDPGPDAQALDGPHLAVAAARPQAGQGIQAGDAQAADVLERFVHRAIDAARGEHVGDRRGAVGARAGMIAEEADVADLRFESFAARPGGYRRGA